MKNKFTKTISCILLVLVLLCSVVTPSFAGDGREYSFEVTYHQTEARTIFAKVNAFRTGSNAWYWNSDNTTKTVCSGLSKLVYDYDLEKIAMQRAAEIVANFAHTRPNGDKWTTAYPSGYSYISENIACGHPTADAVEAGFEEADKMYEGQGHRRNMLSSSATAIGVACVEYNGIKYWVEEFRNPTGSTKATPANDSTTRVHVQISEQFIESRGFQASQASYTLEAGESVPVPSVTANTKLNTYRKITITALPYYLKWSSDDPNIARVENDRIVAVNPGTAVITASCDIAMTTITVTVTSTAEGDTPDTPADEPDRPDVTPSNPDTEPDDGYIIIVPDDTDSPIEDEVELVSALNIIKMIFSSIRRIISLLINLACLIIFN